MNRYLLNKNWKFSYSTGTAALDHAGAAYKKCVDLPHDFMIGTQRTPDARTEGAGGYFQGGGKSGPTKKKFGYRRIKKKINSFYYLKALTAIQRSG